MFNTPPQKSLKLIHFCNIRCGRLLLLLNIPVISGPLANLAQSFGCTCLRKQTHLGKQKLFKRGFQKSNLFKIGIFNQDMCNHLIIIEYRPKLHFSNIGIDALP